MKLTTNNLKQLIKEVLEEASKDAPFGPFTSSKAYVRSQRAGKLSADQASKLNTLDKDSPEMSRVMDQTFGIDNPDVDIETPIEVLRRQQEFRDIVADQSMGYFSESGAEPATKVSTRAIGEAYKIGSWSNGKYNGSIFANADGIYVLENDGNQSFFTPTVRGKIVPITKKFNEQTFMGMFEGRKR